MQAINLLLFVVVVFQVHGQTVSNVSPLEIYPGSILTLTHDIPIASYQDVRAYMGGFEVLVVDVDDPNNILIRAPTFQLGNILPLQISTLSNNFNHVVDGALTQNLTWSTTYQDPGVVGTEGSPRTYFGQESPFSKKKRTIDPNGSNSVLIINCYPTDQDPSSTWWSGYTGGNTAAQEKARQTSAFETLTKRGFQQLSYGAISFSFTYTDFLALPQDDDYYFYRTSDVTAAQADLDAAVTQQEIDDAQAALDTANARMSSPQRTWDMFYDALKAAVDDGVPVDVYDGVMINVAAPFLRGASYGRYGSVTEDRPSGNTVSLQSNTNLWYISFGSHWGRRIHELSHAIASGDLYGSDGQIASGQYVDMMGSHNNMPLFSGYNIHGKLGWYDPANVLELDFGTDYPMDNTYSMRAHGASEDSTANSRYHIIQVQVHASLTYYIQVRQQPATVHADLQTGSDNIELLDDAVTASNNDPSHLLFDTNVYNFNTPAAGHTHKSGVIVTKVTTKTKEELNQKFRTITLLGPDRLLSEGESVSDPANNFELIVVSLDTATSGGGSHPARYSVRIRWTNAVGDPNGLFNLYIRPWDSSWQTNDIWIDSNKNGWETYTWGTEGATGNALRNGDKPWVSNKNRMHAYVWNNLIQDALDVQVTYYLNSPPGIGDNGEWVPHAVRYLDLVGGSSSRAVSSNSDAPEWWPATGEHTCMKVSIAPKAGETEVDDNAAQENIFSFESAGSSPRTPQHFFSTVRNPLDRWALVFLGVRFIPKGWELTINHGWLWLPAKGKRDVEIVVYTDIGRDNRLTYCPGDDTEPKGACCFEKEPGSGWDCQDGLPQQECYLQFDPTVATVKWTKNKSCADVKCGRTACCSVTGGCEEGIPREECDKGQGVFHMHADCKDCDPTGSCCFRGEGCYDNFPESQCSGQFHPLPWTCEDEPCINENCFASVEGAVESTELEVAAPDQSEVLTNIGGIGVAVQSVEIVPLDPPTVNDGVIDICTSNGVDVTFTIEIKSKLGVVCVFTLVTQKGCARGYIQEFCSNVNLDGVYEICITSIPANGLGTATAEPIFVQCTPGSPCKWDREIIPCKWDWRRRECMTDVCPFDEKCECLPQKVLATQKPYCKCELPPEDLPCRFDSKTKQCTREDCPDDPKLKCKLFETPHGPLCDCVPEIVEQQCTYNPKTQRCTRPDCPNDPSKRCVFAPNPDGSTRPYCDCEADPLPCRYDRRTDECMRDDCPENPNLQCTKLMTRGLRKYCKCLGDQLPCYVCSDVKWLPIGRQHQYSWQHNDPCDEVIATVTAYSGAVCAYLKFGSTATTTSYDAMLCSSGTFDITALVPSDAGPDDWWSLLVVGSFAQRINRYTVGWHYNEVDCPCQGHADCRCDGLNWCFRGECTECVADEHCDGLYDGRRPVCRRGKCEECGVNGHCNWDPALPKCQASTATCVECLNDNHCPDPVVGSCDKPTGTCVDCVRDTPTAAEPECPNTAPYCDCDQTCYECTQDHQCPGQQTCDAGVCTGDATPLPSDCTVDADCTDPSKPQCSGGYCVECDNNNHCSGVNNFCAPASFGRVCVPCLQNNHCPGGKCDKETYECVSCFRDSHCSGANPFCDECDHECVECTGDLHCAEDEVCYNHECTPSCSSASDCTTAPRTICHSLTNVCVECRNNAHCPTATPFCLEQDHCVECRNNNHCSGSLTCVDNACV